MLRMRRLIVLVNSFSGAKGMWFFFFSQRYLRPRFLFSVMFCVQLLYHSRSPFKIQIQTTKYLS